jgi:hypothetical protein
MQRKINMGKSISLSGIGDLVHQHFSTTPIRARLEVIGLCALRRSGQRLVAPIILPWNPTMHS